MLTTTDHVWAFVLIVGFPVYAAIEYRRFKKRRADMRSRGVEPDNSSEYRWAMAVQWLLAGGMLAIWLTQGRSLSELGIVEPPQRSLWNGWGFVIIALFSTAVLALQIHQLRAVRRSAAMRESVRKQMANVQDLLPTSRKELRWFYGLSMTAGICEELLYRGWLLWYLSQMMNVWAALPLSALIFGIAHIYQGATGVAKTGPVGLITAAMYVISGSLWLPMLLHAVVDIIAGRMAYETINEQQEKSETSSAPGETPRHPSHA